MWLIVGLGNPGQKYRLTRHNLGFRFADLLAGKAGIAVERPRWRALVGQGRWAGQEVVLAKPQTFMNLSGLAVAELVGFFKLELGRLVVAHDDLDLEAGRLKLAQGGSSGGHKGVASIIERLGDEEFIRLKFGIGRPPSPEIDPVDFVLDRFEPEEAEEIAAALGRGLQAVETLMSEGLAKAQSLYNRSVETRGERLAGGDS